MLPMAGRGLTPGWRAKIPYAARLSLKKKKPSEYNRKESLIDAEKKLAVTSWGVQFRNRGLNDTNYYVQNKL